jgi:hypothetical protein
MDLSPWFHVDFCVLVSLAKLSAVEYVNNDFSKIFAIDFGLQIEWQP